MLALKRFLNLRRGRINARKEVRKQLRIRGRLENDVFKKINTLFRTQLRKTSNEFKITDRFDPEIFVRETSAVMEAVMNQHYKKIFRIIYRNNLIETRKNQAHSGVIRAGCLARCTCPICVNCTEGAENPCISPDAALGV